MKKLIVITLICLAIIACSDDKNSSAPNLDEYRDQSKYCYAMRTYINDQNQWIHASFSYTSEITGGHREVLSDVDVYLNGEYTGTLQQNRSGIFNGQFPVSNREVISSGDSVIVNLKFTLYDVHNANNEIIDSVNYDFDFDLVCPYEVIEHNLPQEYDPRNSYSINWQIAQNASNSLQALSVDNGNSPPYGGSPGLRAYLKGDCTSYNLKADENISMVNYLMFLFEYGYTRLDEPNVLGIYYNYVASSIASTYYDDNPAKLHELLRDGAH